ncbi:hypothetical protein CGCVW01_v011627 [Colletotrichum viniferum]|nr:hypothetical protein CGCVW01_v011627 [Colletotrichum viniferum]
MADWRGDWGFDPEVADTVENDMPPSQQLSRSRLTQLKIIGKWSIFDQCRLELERRRIVLTHNNKSAVMSDDKLQEEAASILQRAEACSPKPSKYCAEFLVRVVQESKLWIEPFRERTRQLSSIGVENDASNIPVNATVNVTLFTEEQIATNIHHGDPVMAAKAAGLLLTKQYTSPATGRTSTSTSTSIPSSDVEKTNTSLDRIPAFTMNTNGNTEIRQDIYVPFLLNDHNIYTRLAAGLSRFVGATMSPNNPNRHTSTDDELRYQARWIWFNEDDPWNQTPADNDEWLLRFKQSVGIILDNPEEMLS